MDLTANSIATIGLAVENSLQGHHWRAVRMHFHRLLSSSRHHCKRAGRESPRGFGAWKSGVNGLAG